VQETPLKRTSTSVVEKGKKSKEIALENRYNLRNRNLWENEIHLDLEKGINFCAIEGNDIRNTIGSLVD